MKKIFTISGFSDEISANLEEQFKILNKLKIGYFEPRGIDGENVSSISDEKIKKNDDEMSLQLTRTTDILAELGKNKKQGQILCGFSMETENTVENSRKKLVKKNLDIIAANNLKQDGAGFGTDTNIITLITADSEYQLPKMSKDAAAKEIFDFILKTNKGED